MKREYYIYSYRLDSNDSCLIWFSDEEDGVIVDENGFVPSFSNTKDLQVNCNKNKLTVKTVETRRVNLDSIQKWLIESNAKIEDYRDFLDAWNLFGDLSKSTAENFDANRKLTNEIYDKIFFGCNIPVITPEGKSYEPTWTKKELKIIRETLNFGFQMFREKVRKQ